MEITRSQKFNINYAAKIVKLEEFKPHPNPEVTKLQMAKVDGFNVVVGIDTCPGSIQIYFPVGCSICDKFLSENNLFSHNYMNSDTTQKGYFEDNGRVKPIRLKGVNSEGFLAPIESLTTAFKIDLSNLEDVINTDFDTIDGIKLCKKYIIQGRHEPKVKSNNPKYKVKKSQAIRLVENQFRFHIDTIGIRKVPYSINPDDLISITHKVHGTSAISAMLLQQIPIKENWFKKILRKMFTNNPIPTEVKYLDTCASRTVIKDIHNNPKLGNGFYQTNIWEVAHNQIKNLLKNGMTLYYEIIGYLPNGSYIQKGFDYGFVQPITNYMFKIHYGIRVYRITYTNDVGDVFEFSAKQVQQWCKNNNLIPVEEVYYGLAKDLYPDLDLENHWNENFIDKLANDETFYMELNSPHCINMVPHEGVVIRKETLGINSYKLKTFRFLGKESRLMSLGESDIENEN